jgi:cysteine desulfurase/selenocysteine lyase
MIDIANIKQDFPILKKQVNNSNLIYLDNAATTQKPHQVIQSIVESYEVYNSNVHRGVHTTSMEATERYEIARDKVAKFINAKSSNEIIFVRNTTEALNLIAYSWGLNNTNSGDNIVVSELEHHSNLVPWQFVSQRTKAELKLIPTTSQGTLDLSTLDELITNNTKLVSIVHVSNLTGTINPVEKIIKKAQSVGSLVCIDAAQSVPHMPVDVQKLNCDFLAFSGHKMLAPPGIGILYAKTAVLEKLEPFLRGGEMVKEVTYSNATWNDIPTKFEAGTPNFIDPVGLGVAIDYLSDIGMENVRQHEKDLITYALDKLIEIPGLEIIGPTDPEIRGGVATFSLNDIHPHDIGTFLDQRGIAIRTGHHCGMPYHTKLGLSATARASFYIYNDYNDIDKLIDGINEVIEFFK